MANRFVEEMQIRIAKSGVRASDIKQRDLLTDEQIADIPVEKVYAWVRTGEWKQRDFKRWLRVLRVID